MRRKMISASTRWMPITYSGHGSCLASASGKRYRNTQRADDSRRMPCSCSVSGRAARRARRRCSRLRRALDRRYFAPVAGSLPFALDLQRLPCAAPRKASTMPRVEMPAALRREVLEGLLARPGRLVGAHRGERVVDVGHRDDARAQRDVVADQAVRDSPSRRTSRGGRARSARPCARTWRRCPSGSRGRSPGGGASPATRPRRAAPA